MALPPYRTTPTLVQGIIDVETGIDLTPFIAFANQLTTSLCTYPDPNVSGDTRAPYSDGFVNSQMELIERWLAAHCYTIFDNQLRAAKAGTVSVEYQYKIDLGLKNSMYGQQAMLMDIYGNLAKYSNSLAVKRQIKVGGFHLGDCGRWSGDLDWGWVLATVEQ